MANFQSEGSISLANFTTTAYLPARHGVNPGHNSFKDGGKVILQMGSSNLSGAVTCTLQISADGEYWAAAQEGGEDVTFSLSSTTPVVEILTGVDGLFWRVAITINSKTGTIYYKAKDTK